MIGKIVKVKGIRDLAEYVLAKRESSWVVSSNLVRDTGEGIGKEFGISERLGRGRDIFRHIVLSVAPSVRVQEWQWREIVEKYLEGMGYGDGNQMVAVRHSDRPHQHCHILVSRLDLETGTLVSDGLEYYRSQDLVQKLSMEYGLGKSYPGVEIFKRLVAQHQIEQAERYDGVLEIDGIVYDEL